MQSQIQPLEFNSKPINYIIIDNKEYFLAKNVCDILELKNISQALSRVQIGDIISNDTPTTSGIQKMSYVDEYALYDLIMASKKPVAIEFKKWVYEILRQIRTTGKFEMQPQNKLPTFDSQFFLQIAQTMAEKEQEVLKLTSTIKEKDIVIEVQEKQIESAKELFIQVANKNGCVKFQMCARQLNLTDTELRNILIEKAWRHKNKHFPTTKGVDNGFVKLLPEEFERKLANGIRIKDRKQTFFITEKGFSELLNIASVQKIKTA